MSRFLALHILCLILLAAQAHAADVLIVQSMRVKAYDEVARGVRSVSERRAEQVALSDLEGDDVAKTVRSARPRVIVAVGLDALLRVRSIKGTPIIYTMVLNPETKLVDSDNITGVGMKLSPERELTLMRQVLPKVRKVALLFDPAKTGSLVKRAQESAGAIGVEIVAREVRRPQDVPGLISGMKGQVQAFLMLPDSTVVTPQTLGFIPLLSVENRIPVIAFSDQYLKNGALLSIGIDPMDIGRQAGELVNSILAGADVSTLSPVEPRHAVVHVNAKIARELGITINRDAGVEVIIHR